MEPVDVVVVGAGPAGTIAALCLAPLYHVVVIERSSEPTSRIGESLPPAARRILTDLDLWSSFVREGHQPCTANRSIWGGADPVDQDLRCNPDGHGWHLDRTRFERWLRSHAVDRGAAVLAPARLIGIGRGPAGWEVEVQGRTARSTICARAVIDAGGRSAPVARRLGASRFNLDRLVCGWVRGHDTVLSSDVGVTLVEAEPRGWWYTSSTPHGQRVIAFHTDVDLPGCAVVRTGRLLEHLERSSGVAAVLARTGFQSVTHGVTASNSAVLVPCSGDGWLAVGDAAVSFDPVSSQGIYNALFTGLAAAEAMDRWFRGVAGSFGEYRRTLAGIRRQYEKHLAFYYGQEQRWPKAPFWRRRTSAASTRDSRPSGRR